MTINNLLPGVFDTDRVQTMLRSNSAQTGTPVEELAERRRKTIPALRFGQADEFGALCAFVCSAHAGYLTGQNLLLDGGAYGGTF